MLKIKRLNLIAFALITIVLIIYDLYKAMHTSFTYDESSTYLHFVNENFMDIISYGDDRGLNNHILNTLFIKLFQAVFGASVLAFRAPNIIAHIFYLIFSFKIFNRYSPKNAILFFILMNANPFLLDFFSLARGYGIAFGLIVTAAYFYCRYLEEGKNKHHALALLLVAFAATANFGLINLFMIFILVHNIIQVFVVHRKISFKLLWQVNYINGIIALLLLAVVYEPIRKLIELKLLIFGGKEGFWKDTVESLLNATSYGAPYNIIFILICKGLVIIFSALFIVRCVAYFISKKPVELTQKFVLFFGLSIFFIALSSVLQHQLFNTPFLNFRFALFLYPLFILMSSFLITDMLAYPYKFITRTFLFLMPAMFLAHTCFSVNTKWYYEWQYDMDTKGLLEELEKAKQDEHAAQITLGSSWLFESAISFYKTIGKLDWLHTVGIDEIKCQSDFYYLTPDDFNKIPPDEVTVIHHYMPSGNYLVKYSKAPVSKAMVNFKAGNNKYLCANSSRNDFIIADVDTASAWEVFTLLNLKSNQYALGSYRNKILSAELKSETEITAIRDKIGEWETFTMVKLNADTVAFKAANGMYLSLDTSLHQVFANGAAIGINEKFKMIPVK